MEKSVGLITMEKLENRRPNTVGSSRIRMKWLLPFFEEAEEYMLGRRYQTLIFQKAYYEKLAQRFEGVKIFDLCDPDWLDPRPVVEMISYCDAVTVTTQAIADYLRRLTDKPIVIIPDRVNFQEVKEVKTEHEGRAKSVVWFGYSNNLKYIERTFDYLHAKGLSLTCITDEMTEHYNTNLPMRFIKYRYEIISQEVVKHDFVIMPDTIDLDGRLKYKSNNKVIQSWAWGMPVAKTPEDIDRFLDPVERRKESLIRQKEVAEKYNITQSVEEYRILIANLKAGMRPTVLENRSL